MYSKGSIEYSFSHFDLETEVFFIKVKKNMFKDQKWIKKSNINKSSLPTVMKKIVESGFINFKISYFMNNKFDNNLL